MNRSVILGLMLMPVSWAAAAAARGDFERVANADDVVSHAAGTLNEQLTVMFPAVERFVISPLTTGAQATKSMTDVTARVLRVGARSSVRVYYNDGYGRRARTVWFDVVGLQHVAVASINLPPRASTVASNALLSERDVLGQRCEPLRAPESLYGKRTKRAIRSGDVLCAEWFEERPAVARGETVTVRYLSQTVTVTTKGVARHDARIGEPVELTSPATKEIFTAVVTAASEAQLHD